MARSDKATDRGSVRTWVSSVDYWKEKAEIFFKYRHTFTGIPGPDGKVEDAAPEVVYAWCRKKFNEARREYRKNLRRTHRSTKNYLKHYKGD